MPQVDLQKQKSDCRDCLRDISRLLSLKEQVPDKDCHRPIKGTFIFHVTVVCL